MVLSLTPFNYNLFSAETAIGHSQIIFNALSVSGIECINDCSILSTTTDAISLEYCIFNSITFQGDGSLLSMNIIHSLSLPIVYTKVFNVDASHLSALFRFSHNSSAPGMVIFGDIQITNCILN